jgi:hypothetical protein
MNEFESLLKQITATDEPKYDKLCVIRDVDYMEQTCSVEPVDASEFIFEKPNKDNYINNVLLGPDRDANNLNYVVPQIGSYGIISYINNDVAYLVNCSNVEEVINIITGGTSTFRVGEYSINIQEDLIRIGREVEKCNIIIQDDVIVFNDGESPMVVIEKLVDKINQLEEKYNTLLNTLKTTVIPLAPAGTYPFAPLYTSQLPITPTQQSEIEDPKILH